MGLDAFFGGEVKKSTKKTTKKSTEKTAVKKSTKKSKKSKKLSSKITKDDEFDEGFDTDQKDVDEMTSKRKKSDSSVQTTMSSKKKNLECKNKKCGYKKTLFKTTLKPEDLVCSKCGGEMQQK